MGFGWWVPSDPQAAECAKNLIGEVVLTGVGLKLDVSLGVFFPKKSNLVVVWRGRVLNYKIHGRFYAVFTSIRCNDAFKNTAGFVAKHVVICHDPLTSPDPKGEE